jgi:hypothetical protein
VKETIFYPILTSHVSEERSAILLEGDLTLWVLFPTGLMLLRKFIVRMEGHFTEWKPIRAGVP